MLHYVVLFKSVLPLEDGVVAQSARERQRLGAVQVVVDPPTVVVLEPLAALDALHFGHVCKKSHNVNAPFWIGRLAARATIKTCALLNRFIAVQLVKWCILWRCKECLCLKRRKHVSHWNCGETLLHSSRRCRHRVVLFLYVRWQVGQVCLAPKNKSVKTERKETVRTLQFSTTVLTACLGKHKWLFNYDFFIGNCYYKHTKTEISFSWSVYEGYKYTNIT
jgi:hypothetical protein